MILDVTKYGTEKNIAAAVTEAVRQAKAGDVLFFPKGEYHFYKDYCQSCHYHMTNTDSFDFPKKYFAMLLENKKNITIEGDGSVFILHGNLCALGVVGCDSITLKNFTVRSACPTNVELTVQSRKGHSVVYTVARSNPFYMDGDDVVFFEQSPFTKKNYWQMRNNEKSWCAVQHHGSTVFRTVNQPFTGWHRTRRLNENTIQVRSLLPKKYAVGATVALSMCKCREGCGLFFWESSNLVSQNITVNYMHGFGWLTQMCENVAFDGVRFEPDAQHKVSSFADCIHVCGCKGKVEISNCYFTQPHDDGINIHGTFLRFRQKIDERTAVFQFVHRQQGGHRAFYVGDQVQLYYRNNLQPCGGIYTVESVTDALEQKTCTVQFKEVLPADIDCKYLGQNNVVAENVTYCPDVEIKNCTFTAIPTRGILCTTSGHVDIHHNHFDNVQMANIYISNDADEWYESGPVRDMQIHHNVFRVPKKLQREWKVTGAVYINPITLGKRITKPIHRNIHVYENDIKLIDGYALYSKGAENITIDTNEKVVIE